MAYNRSMKAIEQNGKRAAVYRGAGYTLAEAAERPPVLVEGLLAVWEASVRVTHDFLTEEAIGEIRRVVPRAIREVPHLVAAWDADGAPAAFIGVASRRIEMLFAAPEARGRGLGRRLVRYAARRYGVREVTVNEQNPLARGFYERMGFRVYRRTARDEAGRPYPLLYMRLAARETNHC